MHNVVEFPQFTAYGPNGCHPEGKAERLRLAKLFAGKTREDMRRFWDGISDYDSFYHGPEGDFDCADIHGYMNMLGDGSYCAV